MILRISELAVLAYLSVSQKSDSKRRLSLFHKSAHLSNVVGVLTFPCCRFDS